MSYKSIFMWLHSLYEIRVASRWLNESLSDRKSFADRAQLIWLLVD